MLDAAAARARESGRNDVADYLRLKAANDAIRTLGCNWLFNTFVEVASNFQSSRIHLDIERQEPHNFAHGSSNMAGSRLNIRHGVRCLSIEAGWARTPSDGIMRSGALALALITHFGMPKAGAELRLVHADTLPNWINGDGKVIDSAYLRGHFDTFLG
jgi:hypothetical protein